MKILHDYHMHTSRCGHATGSVAEYVAQGRRKGLKEIGFSDHLPFVTHRDPQYTMDLSELPDYQADIEKAREGAKDLSVKVGIEADFMLGSEQKIGELLKSYPYDFVIGSVHFIRQWAFDDPRRKDEWDKQDVNATYRRYYELLQRAARSGLYDIMGHVDLVKKFGHRSTENLSDLVHETAGIFKQSGVCIEINTSGLRKPVGEIYPSLDILSIYAEHRVPAVFGSDAHEPKDVGADFDKARDWALAAGYREYQVFAGRRVVQTVKL